jgi:hypothetical protein
MHVCHSTDVAGKNKIQAEGFAHPDPPEGPAWAAADRGYAWFAIDKVTARQTRRCSGWWVWVVVPDDTPEYELSDGEPYPGVYRLSHTWLNEQALEFEQGD